jgi:sugar phosphate isomerase/epimerase
MRLSGAAWSFVGATLRESVEIYRALNINAIDVLALPGFLLDSDKIIENPSDTALAIKELGIQVVNLMFNFAGNFSDRALNHKDESIRRRNIAEFYAVVEFCRQAGIPSVTMLPGVRQDGWSASKALAMSAEALNEMAKIGRTPGVGVFFEAHVGSILESPEETLAFLQANPAVKLTLDYAHFIWNGYSQSQIDVLAPYAGHVHLRQAAPRVMQARWADGTIDFPAVVGIITQGGYEGYFALEYEHDPWLDNDRVDVVCEAIKMRDAVWALLS